MNRALFNLSMRGLGILNYRSMRESGETHFLQRILPCYVNKADNKEQLTNVILDIGANVGAYSNEILRIAPAAKLYCFEPHPSTAEKLVEATNGRATVMQLAVGSTAGNIELFDYEGVDGSSHASVHRGVFERIHKRSHQSTTIEVTTIDSFVEESKIESIALLKIDTEGHELEVLRGASRCLRDNMVDVVHFEFNEMNLVSRVFLSDFFEILDGFRLYRLLPSGWIPLQDRSIENLFAYQNIVAVRYGCPAEQAFK
ncbi:MAG TPA: FkbM family methyltransferase [Albitalea sp.]|jgi:FkbM family methyltransferase